jgi:hypothetical protein
MLPLLLVLLLPGCVFTPRQRVLVNEAIAHTSVAVQDPLLTEIVLELDQQRAIEWDSLRIKALPADAQADPNGWLLRQYAERGPYEYHEVNAWFPLNLFSITKAATTPGDTVTYLNVRKLRRSSFSVANTLFHERAHSFGQIHPVDQTRATNLCDAAYVYGDLAAILTRYRAENTPVEPEETLCPALCESLRRRGLVSSCPA